MFGRSRFTSPLALVCGVAVTALSGTALGQAVSTGTPAIERNIERTSTSSEEVALTLTRGDCRNDQLEYTFNINVTGYKDSYQLEAWAGTTNCATEYADDDTQCWKLSDAIDVDNGVATAVFTPKELFGIEAGSSYAIIDSCDASATNTSRQSFTVYVMLTNSSKVQGTAAAFSVYYDLGGPDAPTDVRARIAENALKVTWEPIDGEEGEVYYKFLCSENPSLADASCDVTLTLDGSTSEGGSGGEGGTAGDTSSGGTGGSTTDTGGTTSTATATSSDAGSGGEDTSASSAQTVTAFECGKVRGLSSSSGFTDRLENGRSYAVSVVAVDQYGNESDPSAAACGTPELVDTFFDRYRADGGQGGGGFCSLVRASRSLSSAGLLLLSLGALAQFRRRKVTRVN